MKIFNFWFEDFFLKQYFFNSLTFSCQFENDNKFKLINDQIHYNVSIIGEKGICCNIYKNKTLIVQIDLNSWKYVPFLQYIVNFFQVEWISTCKTNIYLQPLKWFISTQRNSLIFFGKWRKYKFLSFLNLFLYPWDVPVYPAIRLLCVCTIIPGAWNTKDDRAGSLFCPG